MSIRKKIFILIPVLPVILAILAGTAVHAASHEDPKGMTKVAENESLILYLNEEDTSIAVMDRASGELWYSNPPAASEDSLATPYYKRLLKSQLQVQYYNESVQPSMMDNYNDSIMNGQFVIENVTNGVRITYELGKAKSELLLPERISAERLTYYMELMDKSAARKVKRNYAEDGDYMVLRGGVKDYLKEELSGYFEAAGYTQEDLAADAGEGDVSGEEEKEARFTIPLEYTLDGDELVATVDPNEIVYEDDGFYLVDVAVLPWFGAAGTDESGYIFVPDGSGALINLNNGKTNVSSYAVSVYGQDLAQQVLSNTASETDDEYSVKMPVFGIRADSNAFLAIIEEGDAYARINAGVSGRTSSYNNVYADFSFLQYGPAALSDMVGANSYQLYGERSFASRYRLRYSFLTGAKADYAGMAGVYQNYLEERGILQRLPENTELPFYAELIGAIDRYETFLGIRYSATTPVTTYAQATAIADSLLSGGVSGTKIVYRGWMNGGIHGAANTKVRPLGKLEKSGVSLTRFLSDMKDRNIPAYMTLDLQYVYDNKWWDGYTTLQHAPGYFDHNVITLADYRLMDGRRRGKLADLISPVFASDMIQKLLSGAGKYGITDINLGSATSGLYSDYLEERYTDRQRAAGYYEEAFASCEADMENVLGENANAYSLGFLTDVLDAPLYSNAYQILDREVPFYEMVLHGYITYAGEALNLADDYRQALLRSAESGAGLHFTWTHSDNSVLKETEYDYLYSVEADAWLEEAVADYKELNDAIGQLTSRRILSHEYLEDGLVRVTYDDGSAVYVNYNKKDAEADGIVIPARDYVVKRG